jgi:hypothetical protein
MTRKERIQKAFAYLIGEGKIKNKQQVADIMEVSRPSVSKAYNGYDSYLTNDFLKKFSLSFPEFNLRWLIEGEGEMLKTEPKPEAYKPMFAGEINDYLVRMNEWLKNQIEEERAENRKLREELEKLRNKIDRISAGLPLEYYQVADGDVNPVNLNDPLKNLK